jgi:hypothetical protein
MAVSDVDMDQNAIYDQGVLDEEVYEEVDEVDFGDDVMDSIDID